MDIGNTSPELDAFSFFEEEILAPIQPMVRVYTLYATGLTELRGHVINVAQGGPQFVREIPARARDLNILLIRRFPRDPNRKQRVPFLASPRRLEAALDRLEGKLGGKAHLGFTQHVIPVNRANLAEYVEGQEPQGLQLQVVEQRQAIRFDRGLFSKWLGSATDVREAGRSQVATGGDACLQLNVLLRLHLDSALAKTSEDAPMDAEGSDDDAAESGEEDAWLARAWRHG